ncbi:MAG: twin-arginine translocation signal domain-containing protein [Chitinophagaceae bacterium]
MEKNEHKQTSRRGFLGSIAAGTTALGISAIATPFNLHAETIQGNNPEDPDAWFNKIKGKHRIIFDVAQPHEIFPFAWPKVYLLTNGATGSSPKDCSVVVVLRHSAIGYAMQDNLWEKYKFGEMFKADDPKTKAPATRNPFWKPGPDDFKIPGIGPVAIGINDLQNDGVMFCVCDVALTVNSAVAAMKTNGNGEEIKKEWLAGLLPGIQVVPSGVWAVGRAQEHGCGYLSV